MGNMDALWAYQQADAETEKFELALRATPEYKRYVKMRNYITEQRRVLQKMGAEITERENAIALTQKRFELLQQRYQDGMKKFDLIDKENLAEVERFRKYFEQLHARLAQERREFAELANTLEKDDARLNGMRTKLSRARKEYDELQAFLDNMRNEQKEEREKAQSKASELEKQIDPEMLEYYKHIKRSHSMPIAQADGNRCGGCNVELPVVLVRKLKENEGVVECENCGRILYLQQ